MPDDISSALIAHLYANGLLDDKRNRLNQARVGGAAFGMPSMPELQSPTAPLSTGTTIAEKMQSRPILNTAPLHAAAEMLPWWAHGGESPDTSRKGLGEFVRQAPDALAGLGGAEKLYSTVPRAIASSTGFGLADLASQGHLSDLFSTPAKAAPKKQPATAPAGPPPDDGLSDQQRIRRDALRSKQDKEGYLPKAERIELEGINKIEQDYSRTQNEGRASTKRIADEAKAKRDAKKAEEDAAAAAERERFGKTFSGQHPIASLGMQIGGAALGALLGKYYKMRGATNYNAAINDLASRWREATQQGSAALGSLGGGRWNAAQNAALSRAEFMAQRAQGLQRDFEARKAQGQEGKWLPALTALGGSEVGSSLPPIIDYKTQGTLPTWGEMGERMGMGGAFGLAAGTLAHKGAPLANPAGFSAETAALLKAARALRRRHP